MQTGETNKASIIIQSNSKCLTNRIANDKNLSPRRTEVEAWHWSSSREAEIQLKTKSKTNQKQTRSSVSDFCSIPALIGLHDAQPCRVGRNTLLSPQNQMIIWYGNRFSQKQCWVVSAALCHVGIPLQGWSEFQQFHFWASSSLISLRTQWKMAMS